MCRAWVWSLGLEKLFVGTKNPSGSIQNQRVDVVLAIMCQTDVCFGKGVDERLATRAIHVAVQPDAEGSRVGHFAGEKLFTRDF